MSQALSLKNQKELLYSKWDSSLCSHCLSDMGCEKPGFLHARRKPALPPTRRPLGSPGCMVCGEDTLHLLEARPCAALVRRKASARLPPWSSAFHEGRVVFQTFTLAKKPTGGAYAGASETPAAGSVA